MMLRPALFAIVALGLVAPALATAATPAKAPHHSGAASNRTAATPRAVQPAVAHPAPPILTAAASSGNAAAHPAVVRRPAGANGIAGVDLVRPAAHGSVGGASKSGNGIDGNTARRKH